MVITTLMWLQHIKAKSVIDIYLDQCYSYDMVATPSVNYS